MKAKAHIISAYDQPPTVLIIKAGAVANCAKKINTLLLHHLAAPS